MTAGSPTSSTPFGSVRAHRALRPRDAERPQPALVADAHRLGGRHHVVVGIDARREIPQPVATPMAGHRDLAAQREHLEHHRDVAVVVPARRAPRHRARVGQFALAERSVAPQLLEQVTPESVVGLRPTPPAPRARTEPRRHRATRPSRRGRGTRSSAGRSTPCTSISVKSSIASVSASRGHAEPSRLQTTTSALGATAAVRSCWSNVRCRTVSARSVGRGLSSNCARTAIRRASVRDS